MHFPAWSALQSFLLFWCPLAAAHGQPARCDRSTRNLPHAAGRLDMTAVALAGHSYGGATVSALCAQEPLFKCTIALDPWW